VPASGMVLFGLDWYQTLSYADAINQSSEQECHESDRIRPHPLTRLKLGSFDE
jgi:hypothetical protein